MAWLVLSVTEVRSAGYTEIETRGFVDLQVGWGMRAIGMMGDQTRRIVVHWAATRGPECLPMYDGGQARSGAAQHWPMGEDRELEVVPEIGAGRETKGQQVRR